MTGGGDYRRPGGLPAPRVEQSAQPPPPRIISPGSSDIFRGRLVVIYGTGAGTGLFVYSGSPALGNPPILAVTTSSVDPYGNVVTPSAITDSGMPFLIYSGTPALGNLIASNSPSTGTDSFGNTIQQGVAVYNSASNVYAQLNAAHLNFVNTLTGAKSILTQDTSTGNLLLTAQSGAATPIIYEVADPAGPSTIPAAWHTLTLQNSFTAGTDVNGTSYPPAIRFDNGNVLLKGELVTPGAGGVTGVTFATTPFSAYNPTTNVVTGTVANNTGTLTGAVILRPNGNLQLEGAFGINASIRIDCQLNVYQS